MCTVQYESTFEGTKVLSYFRTLYSTFGYTTTYIILFMIEHCMNSVYALYVYVYVYVYTCTAVQCTAVHATYSVKYSQKFRWSTVRVRVHVRTFVRCRDT